MHRNVRPVVIIIFFAWLCFSIAVLPDIQVGLDQELAVLKDSYLHKYFRVSDEMCAGRIGKILLSSKREVRYRLKITLWIFYEAGGTSL